MATNSPRYKDVSLTWRTNPITGDITALYDEAAVKASVINLVMTMNYEIPFHPEQGCAVTHSLFENITPITAIKIQSSIEDVLQNFEPRVVVVDVQVSVSPDTNGYQVIIVFRVVNQPQPISISLFLEKKR